LNDERWTKIERFIPMNRPGPKPQNNRRILSGIIHVLKTGCRWEYGPYTTVKIASIAGAAAEIWQRIFETVAGSPEPPDRVALDSTHVKAQRCAGDGKGGRRNRRSDCQGWSEQQDSCACTPAYRLRLVLPGDSIGPEIVGATLNVLREADRIFGLGLTFETAAIGFDSLRSAGAPSRIKWCGCDLATIWLQKGFSGAFTGKLAPTAQGKC
jgi:transposase